MDCQNVSPRLVKAILASSIRIKSLKLHRVNAPDLFKITVIENYSLVSFSFSSPLPLGASVVAWLSKCAPLLQHLSINCKVDKKFSFKDQLRLPLLFSLSTGNVVPFALLKFLVACSPNLTSLSVWNSKSEPEWVLISKLFPFSITTSRDIKVDDGFALGILGGPRPLTFQPLDRIIGTKKRKNDISLPQLLYCPPLLDINYDDI
ncbi:hypothetical protein DSO57_1024049 [Entomophthora muscae]|uniref:Uncharacterized protein n=1 Tax=Entomophthora muscae TaxID=34485 RepID=A0ACC2RHD1_9FUNG|nr:hypothetical protein DSO57_1024049 [Entomophthora muscae]